VPHRFACPEAADCQAVLHDVRDDVDFGVSLDEPPPGLLHGRAVEVAEAAAEAREILVGQCLIAEEQHLIIEPRPMHGREGLGVERAKIDALHVRPEDTLHGPYAHEAGAFRRGVQLVVHLIAHEWERDPPDYVPSA
jgi:hypothetical protein